MISACRYARTNKLPYFGICLGMQIAVIEFARSVLGYADANSREFDETCEHPVIDLMKDQQGVIMGGTMRLGSYPCKVKKGSILEKAYKNGGEANKCAVPELVEGQGPHEGQGSQMIINERHRHRYEFNNDYREQMQQAGLVISGTSPDDSLVEAVEVAGQFYVGVQFHPEFKSRPNAAGPLFVEFLRACEK